MDELGTLTPTDDIGYLRELTGAGALIESEKARVVSKLRDENVSWTAIGEALQTSKQAAHRKYSDQGVGR